VTSGNVIQPADRGSVTAEKADISSRDGAQIGSPEVIARAKGTSSSRPNPRQASTSSSS
jgi:hypothetical protein